MVNGSLRFLDSPDWIKLTGVFQLQPLTWKMLQIADSTVEDRNFGDLGTFQRGRVNFAKVLSFEGLALKWAEPLSLWAENRSSDPSWIWPLLLCRTRRSFVFLQAPAFRVRSKSCVIKAWGCEQTHRGGGGERQTQRTVKPETFFIRIMHEPRE